MNCKHPTLYVLGPENKPAPYGYCMLCEVARLRSELDAARADMHAWEDTANDWKAKYDEARRALEQYAQYIRKLDRWVEHREHCRFNGISGLEWSISSGGKCSCGLANVLASEPALSALPPSRGSEGADSGGG